MAEIQETPAVKDSKINHQKPGSHIALMFIAAISAGFLGGWVGSQSRVESERRENQQHVNQQIISSEGQLISEIARNVGPSVVSVNVVSQGVERDSFFGFSQPVELESAGT